MSGSFTFLGESSFEWAVAVGLERDHRLRSQDPRDGSERSFFSFFRLVELYGRICGFFVCRCL